MILFFQSLQNPFLDVLSEIIRLLAEPLCSALVILVLYWCLNRETGERLALLVLSGSLLCSGVKNIARVERPFLGNAAIRPQNTGSATGYSFPSGHTQNGTTTALALAQRTGKRWLSWAAVLFGILVGLSRVYHGVHTGYDVAAGLLLGALWAVFGGKLLDYAEKKKSHVYYLIALLPAGIGLLGFLPFWQPRPPQYEDTVMLLGLYLGMLLGFFGEKRWVRFSLPASWKLRLAQGGLGLLGTGVVFLVFSFFPSLQPVRFFKYFVFALWATLGQPAASKAVFQKTLLHRKERSSL